MIKRRRILPDRQRPQLDSNDLQRLGQLISKRMVMTCPGCGDILRPTCEGGELQIGSRGESQGPRTLFATHYQELTQLEKHLPRLRNFSVAVKEWNDDIVFVRRVVPGAADRSYGIQVARLAGLPLAVIDRAKTILAKLESDEPNVTLPAQAPLARPRKKIAVRDADDDQLSLL